jgi:hypothetical protein
MIKEDLFPPFYCAEPTYFQKQFAVVNASMRLDNEGLTGKVVLPDVLDSGFSWDFKVEEANRKYNGL